MSSIAERASKPEAERAFIGHALMDAAVYRQCGLGSAAFTAAITQAAWEAIGDEFAANGSADIAGVYERLREAYSNASEWLSEITAEAIGIPVGSAVRIVTQAQQLRTVATALGNGTQRLADGEDPDVVTTDAVTALNESRSGSKSTTVEVAESVGDALDVIEAKRLGKVAGASTGIEKLTALLGGYQPGRLYIIAARPGMGKTSLALTGTFAAATNGTPVLYLSYEMGASEVTTRLISMASGVPYWHLDRGIINGTGPAIQRGAGAVSRLPVSIDTKARSLAKLTSAVYRWHAGRPGGMVVVDYLGLMSLPGKQRHDLEVGAVTAALKALAEDLRIPVIALSQLNRGSDKEQRRPRLSDLRDSGSIEQDADAVIFIQRETEDDGQGGQRPMRGDCDAYAMVEKNRGGSTGAVLCGWHAETMRFADLEGGE